MLHEQQRTSLRVDLSDGRCLHRGTAAQGLDVQPARHVVGEERAMTHSAQYSRMQDSRMPGGGISRRPLHLIILADCSGGMKGEKIQALNYAIADMMPHLVEWEQDQEQAQGFVRAIAFATEPGWHIEQP